MVIAFLKTSLVILYFMHVHFTSRLTQVAMANGFVWLIGLTLSDVLTRTIVP
jgi:caa(3)-type oxidase subunit IV